MPTTRATTLSQRQAIMHYAQAGHTYAAIADQLQVSPWTVRKWARRTRGGDLTRAVSRAGRRATGPLAQAAPLVRYLALRLKRQHPGWGAAYICKKLAEHPGLRGRPVPGPVSVWRYWRSFGPRLLARRRPPELQPPAAGVVHGVWQFDFKESVEVPGVGPVTLAQARDRVGRATVLQRVHPATQPGQRIVKPTTAQVQADCRLAFAQWGLPDAIQTDRASLFRDADPTPFPTRLTLWWLGLGITHHLIPRHQPQCNGSVERSHLTTTCRTLSRPPFDGPAHLQTQLDADWAELNASCPSRARGCNGQPPLVAFPDLLRPRRLYFAEQELADFDLKRVYRYLAEFTWVRLVNTHGQLSLGGHRYGVGTAWASYSVSIRFDLAACAFSFTALQAAEMAPLTRPAQGLSAADLCGAIDTAAAAPRQLSFPWVTFFPPTQEACLSETPAEACD